MHSSILDEYLLSLFVCSFLFYNWYEINIHILYHNRQPLSAVEVTQSHRLTEGKTRVWIIILNTIKGISTDRGENQREKFKVSLLPVSPYYTTLSCAWTHYLVRTDPTLRRPLTDSGCTYASYFTSTVTPEVKAEQSSNSKSRVGWSSDLGVGWNL